jgi:hypothetical protein
MISSLLRRREKRLAAADQFDQPLTLGNRFCLGQLFFQLGEALLALLAPSEFLLSLNWNGGSPLTCICLDMAPTGGSSGDLLKP